MTGDGSDGKGARAVTRVPRLYPALVAGGLLLVASDLATILAREWLGSAPGWLLPARTGILALACALLWRRMELRRLSGLAGVLFVVVMAQAAAGHPGLRSALTNMITLDGGMLDIVARGVAQKGMIALPVLVVLLLVCRGPRRAFLFIGNPSAPVGRMALLRLGGDGLRWSVLAPVSATLIAVGTFGGVLLTVFGGDTAPQMQRLAPLLPAILLLAALNALLEGIIYRNAVCGPLRNVLGVGTLAFLAGAYFGIAHFYGAPSGLIGVVMAAFLGWFLCRAMIETRGFLLPWAIHFVQDVVIFSLAAVMVSPP